MENIIDINSLKKEKKFTVKIDDKKTELQIGDKLHFPKDCPFLKTVVQLTVFEDKSVNYVLKWHDGNSFQSEAVSINDLHLLNCNFGSKPVVALD